jgi:outer membrane protein OmpA-like peptidoglycan-associated protein/Mg-chelatase subunit ChlD
VFNQEKMNVMKKNASLCVMLLILMGNMASAQELSITPRDLTNRPLGFSNDATAVGWNPGALALVSEEVDLLFALPVNEKFNRRGPFSIFGKYDHFALGYIAEYEIDNAITTPGQFYFGTGTEIFTDVYGGISGNWVNARPLIDKNEDKLRYNMSLVVTPMRGVITSYGISTMYYGNHVEPVHSFGFNYSPTPYMTILTTTRYAKDFPFNNKDMDITAGLSYGLYKNHIITSASYSSAFERIVIGVEFNIGGFSAGLLSDPKTPGVADGMAILRMSSLDQFNNAPALRGTGKLGVSRDADCVKDAFKWQYRIVKSPKDLINVIQSAGMSYEDLLQNLQKLSPNPDQLFDKIRDTYYPHTKTLVSQAKGTSTSYFTASEHSIYLEKVDSTDKQRKKAIVQVRDSFGRNVSGLPKKAFDIKDTSMIIYSVEQTTASTSMAADIVVLMDCSGSMSSSINGVRTNVANFVNNISARGIDARIGCILYGDEVSQTLEPTTSIKEFQEFFAQAQATAPDEISSEAIYRATQMSFRPNAQKIVLLITDDCALQENANHTEESLTKDLWNAGAQLYSVVNPAKHNAGIVTRLSLGRDYDIAQPFTEVLDNISGDITTTYEITYGPKPIVKPQVFVIRGTVTNDKSWAVGASIAANGSQGNSLSVKSNSITGNYEIVVPITKKDNFTAVASASGYLDEMQNINAQSVKVGDTLIRNFIMKRAVITLCGTLIDENTKPVQGVIRLENSQTNKVIDSIKTSADGKYCFELPDNTALRFNAKIQDFIVQPIEFNSATMKKGDQNIINYQVMSIDHAIATGATFKLKNIFFEFGKADITPASAPELQRLYDFLREYPKIRVEVSAHTDAVGSDEANMTLSNNRAKSVVQYLQRLGIDASRMVSQGYGETKPVGDNATDEGRALNRRVEFKLIR